MRRLFAVPALVLLMSCTQAEQQQPEQLWFSLAAGRFVTDDLDTEREGFKAFIACKGEELAYFDGLQHDGEPSRRPNFEEVKTHPPHPRTLDCMKRMGFVLRSG